jgi:competence protein ComEA
MTMAFLGKRNLGLGSFPGTVFAGLGGGGLGRSLDFADQLEKESGKLVPEHQQQAKQAGQTRSDCHHLVGTAVECQQINSHEISLTLLADTVFIILREIRRQRRPIIQIAHRRYNHQAGARNGRRFSCIIADVKAGLLIFALALCLAVTGGCTSQQQNPDQIREKTAQATATLKTDAKAVAAGVREGLSRGQPLDLNHATKAQLRDLPGITDVRADRVMAGRPYGNSQELASRHILPPQVYDRIKDRVTAKN